MILLFKVLGTNSGASVFGLRISPKSMSEYSLVRSESLIRILQRGVLGTAFVGTLGLSDAASALAGFVNVWDVLYRRFSLI